MGVSKTMETLTNSMDLFGTTFKSSNMELAQAEREYANELTKAGESRYERQLATEKYNKSIRNITNGVLRKDKRLRLEFPFNLSAANKEKLAQNPEYYLNDGILTTTQNSGKCIHCGKSFISGDIIVEDDDSAISTCLKCANPDIDIDGTHFKLEVLS